MTRPQVNRIYHKVTTAGTRQYRYVCAICPDGLRYRRVFPRRRHVKIGPILKVSFKAWSQWADDGYRQAKLDDEYLEPVTSWDSRGGPARRHEEDSMHGENSK